MPPGGQTTGMDGWHLLQPLALWALPPRRLPGAGRGLVGLRGRVPQGVYFPQAPPQDRLSCPLSGLALVGAAGGLSGTPGWPGASMPR